MHKAFYEVLLLLSDFFNHVPIPEVLELLPLEIPLTLLPMELTLVISE